jgi:hypothetical protein
LDERPLELDSLQGDAALFRQELKKLQKDTKTFPIHKQPGPINPLSADKNAQARTGTPGSLKDVKDGQGQKEVKEGSRWQIHVSRDIDEELRERPRDLRSKPLRPEGLGEHSFVMPRLRK